MKGKINANKLAKQVSEHEVGIEEVSIAQIKEVMKCLFKELNEFYTASQIMELIERY